MYLVNKLSLFSSLVVPHLSIIQHLSCGDRPQAKSDITHSRNCSDCVCLLWLAAGRGEKRSRHGALGSSGRCYYLRSCVRHLAHYERLISGGNISFSDAALADACG